MKKKKNNEKKKNIIIVIIICAAVALIAGGTYSWWMWRSATNTLVNITVIGGDLKITGTNVTNNGMVPISTNNCATSSYTLIGEATVNAQNDTTTAMRVTPRLDISLSPQSGRTLSTTNKSFLKWALIDTTNGSTKTCLNPDYQGSFDKVDSVTVTRNATTKDVVITSNGVTAVGTNTTMNISNISGSSVTSTLTFEVPANGTETKKYKVYVWLDGDNDTNPNDSAGDGTPGYEHTNYGTSVSDPMQDLSITVKWSTGSSMIQE